MSIKCFNDIPIFHLVESNILCWSILCCARRTIHTFTNLHVCSTSGGVVCPHYGMVYLIFLTDDNCFNILYASMYMVTTTTTKKKNKKTYNQHSQCSILFLILENHVREWMDESEHRQMAYTLFSMYICISIVLH